jgi:hypothetical protein
MEQGRGIIHAEMPVHAEGVPDPKGLQLWVDLPKQVRCFSQVGPGDPCMTLDNYSLRWWYVPRQYYIVV